MAWGCSESGFLDMGRSGRKACPLCGWLVHPGFAVGVVEQGMGGWVGEWVGVVYSSILSRAFGCPVKFSEWIFLLGLTRASRSDTGGMW